AARPCVDVHPRPSVRRGAAGQLLQLLLVRRSGAEPGAAGRGRRRVDPWARARRRAGVRGRHGDRPRPAGRPRRRPLGARAGPGRLRRRPGPSGRRTLDARRARHRRSGVLRRHLGLRAVRHAAARPGDPGGRGAAGDPDRAPLRPAAGAVRAASCDADVQAHAAAATGRLL
ncbi:MAG: Rod shape-determining protein MreD, partial [uncultured Nocardioidaceae bacterium]